MKVIFLDRDGIINYDSMHYIKSPDEWKPIPGSVEAIAALYQAGYRIGVATNQSGIARGYYSETVLADIHDKMLGLVRAAGGDVEKIVHCPHMPDEGCECRKPRPGMLNQLAQFFGLSSPEGVPFVGDRISDVIAANAVNATPIHIKSPMTEDVASKTLEGVRTFSSLAEYAQYCIANDGQ